MKSIHVVTCCYGGGYALLATEFMWPSLVKHNPKVFTGRQVSHRIYCRDDDIWHVADHCQRLKACGIHTYVNTRIIPNLPLPANDPTNQKRIRNNYVWVCLADAMGRAMRENAVMVYALPDHVFGHGLQNALGRMNPGDYYVCCHPRVALEPVLPTLEHGLNSGGFASNSELVSLCFSKQCRHSMVQAGFDHLTKCWRAADRGDHYAVWFRDPVPVLIDPTEDLVGFFVSGGYCGNPCFEMLDHDLVVWSHRQGRLKWAKGSREFFWMELTSKDTYTPEPFDPSYVDAKIDEPGETFLHGEPYKFWKGST